jgi:DNA polymerase-3 subunit epsilon
MTDSFRERPTPERCEEMAALLESTGDYRILRRLAPMQVTAAPAGFAGRLGAVIDFETTGLDARVDEILEISAVKFRYGSDDEIAGVAGVFHSYNQPSAPIPEKIMALTGIRDEDVAGQSIDADALRRFFADVSITIAHNAGFDRAFAEKSWPFFENLRWSCSATEIDWRGLGFGGARLGSVLMELGVFHGAHRAQADCEALVEILSRRTPGGAMSLLSVLLSKARRSTLRIWAQDSPFALKESLKQRGYRWSDGSDGNPRSWYVDVEENAREAELKFLREEIFARDVDLPCRPFTAVDRFSARRGGTARNP